ncbi:peptide-methionine (S)-S-oxide reductase MsrA [Hyphococcus flavus]|uniref:Peptide methionine sulfoxide reductase MsrA n=1 Tax=Hyphococcus flavus TaxID=1866326 RepID=A0AAF0CEM3_9PROT|nr:peptide-methionine (S)-S-oxide reductase MsrA [Hyphococcus flavus]WDI30434.1 peptide-methionine (S)-S-oxide reductase MsrA [Hyphococcus flavus]
MTEIAVFAAGCFWGVEQTFRDTKGVTETEVGYTGGHKESPTYEQVCRKSTGHAEAVRVTYDPGTISYDELLDVFWNCHNPTQVNRQGPDIGDQYRTAVFTLNDQQQKAAVASRENLSASGQFDKPIATVIEPLGTWWKAEEYHQQYFEKNGGGACHIPS